MDGGGEQQAAAGKGVDEAAPEVTLEELRKRMADFARERDWEQFHSPRNLLLAMVRRRSRDPILRARVEEKFSMFVIGRDTFLQILRENESVRPVLVLCAILGFFLPRLRLWSSSCFLSRIDGGSFPFSCTQDNNDCCIHRVQKDFHTLFLLFPCLCLLDSSWRILISHVLSSWS